MAGESAPSRVAADTDDLGARFRIERRGEGYNRQYFNSYLSRARILAPAVSARAREVWSPASQAAKLAKAFAASRAAEGDSGALENAGESGGWVSSSALAPAASGVLFPTRVLDLDPSCPHPQCVTGVLWREMPDRPTILDEYADTDGAPVVGDRGGLWSSGAARDTLFLEDASGRVRVSGKVAVAAMERGVAVSGVVVAVVGSFGGGGDLEAIEMCSASGLVATEALANGAEVEAPLESQEAPRDGGGSRYLAVVSGLRVGDPEADPVPAQLMVDFLCGAVGDGAEGAKVAHVVVAGDSLVLPRGADGAEASSGSFSRSRTSESATSSSSSSSSHGAGDGVIDTWASKPLDALDGYLSELSAHVPVTLMPGASDPSQHTLPQQPMYRFMFRGAGKYTSFRPTTNPAHISVGGLSLLGTSGQNVEDLCKYSEHVDPKRALAHMIDWAHIAPTAPDTLPSYPFSEDQEDPYVLDVEALPGVLFAGNQSEFATAVHRGVRIISVPVFADTGEIVLVDLDTKEAKTISFATGEKSRVSTRAGLRDRAAGSQPQKITISNDDDDDGNAMAD